MACIKNTHAVQYPTGTRDSKIDELMTRTRNWWALGIPFLANIVHSLERQTSLARHTDRRRRQTGWRYRDGDCRTCWKMLCSCWCCVTTDGSAGETCAGARARNPHHRHPCRARRGVSCLPTFCAVLNQMRRRRGLDRCRSFLHRCPRRVVAFWLSPPPQTVPRFCSQRSSS